MLQILSLALVLAGSPQNTPAALRIVVIEGEDAVNIIQQNTAVRPIVEVRDRNNLPVSGALVTFSIEGGKAATFGGASTLTVATNAAGQAAVTGLTPSAAGAFQIQVSAAFQGQVATATIAQTNVVTAAQAAAGSAASGSSGTAGSAGGGTGGGAGGAGGAAGGAGGGLSATTIAVAGAAVAGGALAATQIADKVAGKGAGKTEYAGSFSGTIINVITTSVSACTYTRSVSATARLRLEGDSNLQGTFEHTGTDTVIASTCTVPATPPAFVGGVEVSGPPSRLSGRNAIVFPTGTGMDGGTINGEQVLTFEGSLSGDAVTGTLKYETRTQSTGGATPGGIQAVATGTFTVTLQKS